MTVVVTHSTPADASFSATGATAWDANHVLAGVGTMAEQNANAVAITGGTITNATLSSPKIDLILDTNGNEILGFSPTTSATDYLVVKNGIGVGAPLHVYADGSSANTGLHIQPKGTGLVTISDGLDFNKGIRFRSSSSAASAITLLDAVSTAGRVVTLPDATTTLVGRDTTDTLTNKSISGSTNTLSNIGNASLTNSAITINGVSTSLGGSISVGTVTSVTGTAPVVSSGGATPAISMAAATTSVDGYLTSTNWTTFNNKANSGANTDITSVTLTTGTITTSPSSSTDIVNKSYADSISSGINFHAACQYATVTALPANTYNNGAGGVGATLTAVANGALTVDGSVQTVGDRVLVKNEVTQANNGVYVITQVGSVILPYILTRASDYDSSGSGNNEIDQGDMMLVILGTVNANTSWVQQTALPITVGTTALVFLQFAAVQTYSAGTGLTLTTNQFSITNVGTAGTYGSASNVPVFVTNAQGQVTSVTNTAIAIANTAVSGLGTMSTQSSSSYAALAGATFTGQLKLVAGAAGAGLAPIEFQSGTLQTTAEAGAMEYDGTAFYSSMANSTRGVIPTEQIVVLTGTNTLTSQTGVQPIFDGGGGPTNGAITLPVGTYEYELNFALTGMSATSGSFGFGLGGTATKTFSYNSMSAKAGTALATSMAMLMAQGSAANTALQTASTGTVGTAIIKGIMRVTVTGTVIPQVSLTVASAAVVQTNSYFKVSPIGNATVATVGNWS